MDRQGRKLELLSPAGSFGILKAVAGAGADAVYAAGSKFGARAYAVNFTEEELLEAIDYLHLRGKRLYLAVNTLLKDKEIQELPEFLGPLYEAGLDAAIVQDMGVLRTIRAHFPELPIHASTQMGVTGAYGARLLLDAGCSRIVTARELSLAEIADIHKKTGAEIESFVHGALCYCYSGQCLLSSMIGGRSGNRGRCAQPCRLPYRILDGAEEAGRGKKQGDYLLSLKDLCAIDLIPQMAKSGVYSFKIEGRMKQAEYAAGVTAIYRKYMDRYEADPEAEYRVSEEDRRALLGLGSRCGFTDGYYARRNGRQMAASQKPSYERRERQKLWDFPEKKEKIKGILRLSQENPARLVLEYQGIEAEAEGARVQAASSQPLTAGTVRDKIGKTGDTPFEFETLDVELDGDVFLPAGDLKRLRREAIRRLEEAVLDGYRRKQGTAVAEAEGARGTDACAAVTELGTGGTDTEAASCTAVAEAEGARGTDACAAVTELGTGGTDAENGRIALRVLTETEEQFSFVLRQPEVRRVYLESSMLPQEDFGPQLASRVKRAREAGKECCLALPYVFRMEEASWFFRNWQKIREAGPDGYLARNYDGLGFLGEMGVDASRIQGDQGLYAYSQEAARGLLGLRLGHCALPAELNGKELRRRGCAGGELLVYGRQPLMVSAQCLRKNTMGCDGREGVLFLKDRCGKQFPVRNRCRGCHNVIYNASPLSLLHHYGEVSALAPAGVRMSFTFEGGREMERVFAYYREAVRTGTVSREGYLTDYTNGHWKRGVE